MGLFDTVTITFVAVRCCNCGVVFGIDSVRNTELAESHDSFWCPNGHAQHYTGQTEKEKRIAALERETRALKSSRDYWSEQSRTANQKVEHQTHRINGYKGVVARTKRKIAAGRCPCCSHQFKDLESHMKNRHPKWSPETAAEAIGAKES